MDLNVQKIEDLKVGDILVFDLDDGNRVTTFLSHIESDGADEPFEYKMQLLISDPEGIVHEIEDRGLYNQRVLVKS